MTITRHSLFVLLATVLLGSFLQAADAPTKRVRHDEFFTLIPAATDAQMNVGDWSISDPEKGNSGADDAKGVLAAFKQTSPKRAKEGIFIYSQTHSMEWSDKDKAKYAASRQVQLLNNKVWREAENKLVEELVVAANAEGVPVWALVRGASSGASGLHTYKLLTDAKLTLKK